MTYLRLKCNDGIICSISQIRCMIHRKNLKCVVSEMPHRARCVRAKSSLQKAEPAASYTVKDGIRYVNPYIHRFVTFAKGRWLGRELLSVLMSEFGAHPQEYWKSAIKSMFVTVGGKKVSSQYKFKNGDKLEHMIHRHEPCVVGSIKFVGQDERILAVDKPSSIPVHPSGAYRFNSMLKILENEPLILNQPRSSIWCTDLTVSHQDWYCSQRAPRQRNPLLMKSSLARLRKFTWRG